MSAASDFSALRRLVHTLRQWDECVVAVSGGIDSMLLAWIAHRLSKNKVTVAHAVSAAVPSADTLRVRHYAASHRWNLQEIQTGEMQNEEYRNNPVNRCYFCKSCLYQSLRALGRGQVLSGANMDDLGDYRPGLTAAKENDVRHPYIEAGIDKQTIRRLAGKFGLHDLEDLPASPCLASRIESGIFIDPVHLALVGDVETWVRGSLQDRRIACDAVRFRIRAQTLVLELDGAALHVLPAPLRQGMREHVTRLAAIAGLSLPVEIAPYQRGSAFVGEKT